jgi:hypothetical protein
MLCRLEIFIPQIYWLSQPVVACVQANVKHRTEIRYRGSAKGILEINALYHMQSINQSINQSMTLRQDTSTINPSTFSSYYVYPLI